MIERRQENIRPQRACYSALRNARLGRLPALFRDHSCFKKTSDHLQNAPIANLFGYKINKAVLVNAIKSVFTQPRIERLSFLARSKCILILANIVMSVYRFGGGTLMSRFETSRAFVSAALIGALHVVTIRGDSYRLRAKRRSGLLQKTTAPEPATGVTP